MQLVGVVGVLSFYTFYTAQSCPTANVRDSIIYPNSRSPSSLAWVQHTQAGLFSLTLYKVAQLIGGGSVIKRAYPVQLIQVHQKYTTQFFPQNNEEQESRKVPNLCHVKAHKRDVGNAILNTQSKIVSVFFLRKQ